jgi:hypothetical protein
VLIQKSRVGSRLEPALCIQLPVATGFLFRKRSLSDLNLGVFSDYMPEGHVEGRVASDGHHSG